MKHRGEALTNPSTQGISPHKYSPFVDCNFSFFLLEIFEAPLCVNVLNLRTNIYIIPNTGRESRTVCVGMCVWWELPSSATQTPTNIIVIARVVITSLFVGTHKANTTTKYAEMTCWLGLDAEECAPHQVEAADRDTTTAPRLASHSLHKALCVCVCDSWPNNHRWRRKLCGSVCGVFCGIYIVYNQNDDDDTMRSI